jgi:hypothetical protein
MKAVAGDFLRFLFFLFFGFFLCIRNGMGYKVSIISTLKIVYTQIEIFSNSSNKYVILF